MSEISRTSENNRLAYTSDTNRLSVGDGNHQTGGTDETGGADRKGYLVNYIQQIQHDLESGDVHGGTLAQKKQWLQQALDMLHAEFPESSGWDPTADTAPIGFQANQRPTSTAHSETEKHFFYRTGSQSKVIVDRGDPNDKRPTTAEFWTTDNGIYLPDNASEVNYQYDQASKTITVQVSFADGSTKTMIYHDVDRKGFKLKIEAANPDRVKMNLPAELNGKVTVTQHKNEADGSGGSERVGDKPTGTEDGADLYDTRKDVNISPIKDGTGQRTIVRAGGNVNITANSNSEYYKVEYKDGKYLIHVFANEEDAKADNGKGVNEKEVIEVDAKLAKKLNFDVDPSRVEFLGDLKGKDIHTLKVTNTNGGGKIKIISDSPGGQGGAPLVNGDSAVTSFTTDEAGNKIAVYSKDADVNLHANFDDDVKTHDVTASGTVTINPSSQSDTVTVKYENGKYIVTITPAGGGEPEVFRVDADKLGKLVINAKGVKYEGTLDISKIKANYPGDEHHKDEADRGVDLVAKAMSTNKKEDWDAVNTYFNSLDRGHANDTIRGIIEAMDVSCGRDPAKLKALLKLIPADVRQNWIEKCTSNDDKENRGEERNTIQTRDLLQDSLS